MRAHEIINIKEHNHPHARGEDEWFSVMFGQYQVNVDEAHRLIASGEIEAIPYQMPIKKGGQMLLRLTEEEFGDENSKQDLGQSFLKNAGTNRDYGKTIPEEKYNSPALMIMWDSHKADPKIHKEETKAYPLLVDGNHRLEARYLKGDEGSMPTQVIQNWNDIAKFTYDRSGKRLCDKKKFTTKKA